MGGPRDDPVAGGEKAKTQDILAAIRALQRIESEQRPASQAEQAVLARFGGFGAVALSLFPNPATGQYKTPAWQALGEELVSLLSPDEYVSAKRTTFNAFYTSPSVVRAMYAALARLGVPDDATVLEPGCGSGNFLRLAPPRMRFIGVEMDLLSGRIARALHPGHDIRIENFRDTRLPDGQLDAVIGNPPFADIKLDHGGERFSLHDFFFAKAMDALKPGGVLALVTSHFSLDKQKAAAREYLADRGDFLGAVRLPSDAFKKEGTSVVTDILFLRKRAPGQEPKHADADWLHVALLSIEGAAVPVNRYFLNHPEMVLGTWSRDNLMYGHEGFSVLSNGDLAGQLREAIGHLPVGQVIPSEPERPRPPPQPAFVPPPPLRHVTEGSFFVGPDHAIHQLENGRAEPVVYGSTALTASQTMTGKRLAGLIGLRDRARRVLQSQNEGWPQENRDAARRELNRAYDLFFHSYGPINKTTFSETKDGTQVRRMPNLTKFREDPDAMLVMSLEEYDEATGKAEKSAIMTKDVVGPKPPVTHVGSAEEGFLVSLDHRGAVDIGYIAQLYGKSTLEVIAELGELIFHDPETQSWQTADAYLSGNVREKFKTAEAAGPEYTRNAEALRPVQPEDVLPGEIDANLGAPWIPATDIRQFAAELFNVPLEAFKIGHLKKDAVWAVEPDYRALQSVVATADFGTSRINGTTLLDSALNQKTPVIYDTIHTGGREERVVNQVETLAAREKQRLIKERFKSWIFSDPDRTERLVRDYNDTYNNLRPRLFDGSHLEFPGMSKAVTLKPHQVDGIWRCMTAGNTLLAHTVGAGKSYLMAAAGMKMKQAGLIKKPLYCIPNHLLEQFSREFMQLYPNAKLLVAGKEDFTKERRKLLTAKIATGDWDGIIVTHSSFERIGMSKEYQEKFLRDQIKEYERLLVDKSSSSRNIIKTIEKQKAKREERLKELAAEGKKDDGLVFDELGIDHIFYDESAAVKNLETPTKMDRVAGIQTGGSERAFDTYMKCCYLDELHQGHGVTFASGTPISNSMVEMYTVQRFLDPKGLKDRGIDHFDAWAATFGEVVDTMEISPDGTTLKPRSRFAKFVNLPELTQMFRSFADVQTAEMLDLPRPALLGGKPQTIACPMSDDQARLQKGLVRRYERLRSEKVDPREDNALNITTDGRKLALDGRMLGAREDFAGSKINEMVGNVLRILRKTEGIRGTQMIFCDMGVHPKPFSAYDEIVEKLVDHAVPRAQIAVMGDADSDAKKAALFEKVRAGTVRILLGSTQKMGTGTNVQKRLVALHHLDAPWKPAEVEQREGRILRQGNENEVVSIYRYVTEGSFDAYMWQTLETKARFIAQVMTGKSGVRRAEDIGGEELSYAEVKAIASGNPAVLTLAEADAELQRLLTLKKHHADEQYVARRSVRDLPVTITRLAKRLDGLAADAGTARSHADEPIVVGEIACSRDRAIALLGSRLDAITQHIHEVRSVTLGRIQGLRFGVVLHRSGAAEVSLEGTASLYGSLARDAGPRAVLNAVDRLIESYEPQCEKLRQELAIARGQLRDYDARLGVPFAHHDYIERLTGFRDQLKAILAGQTTDPGVAPCVGDVAEQVRALLATRTIEAAPPVTWNVRRRGPERPAVAAIRERLEESGSPLSQNEAIDAPQSGPATIIESTDAAMPVPRNTAPELRPSDAATVPRPVAASKPRRKKFQKWLF